MSLITEDKNSKKFDSSAFSKDSIEFFNFNVATNNFDVLVNYDNVNILSDEVNFTCSRPKLDIQNEFINIAIIKNKHSFKIVLKNPNIDFTDNKSSFQIKSKKEFLVVSISTPFKISIEGDKLLFSNNIDKNILLNNNFTDKQKAEISQMKDNKVLLISEEKKKTFLPYTIDDICAKYNSEKYNTIEELIEKEYTVPNEYYNFPIISRFKEGYKLIKEKEHGSMKKALDLGFELMFNSNLNPPIITACKNLEELNIYLDCLEENELHKFLCFDIVYEVPPTKI